MNNKIEDQSNDRSYFVITPQLVWALCQDPYEYTLWSIVKMVAGEQGECFLSTPDLAAAAMMSTGKVSSCRRRLLDVGLLVGELRRDPGYPQPVWHLIVPDLWTENLKWREANPDLLARIATKREQRKSVHPVKPSPGEEGITPGEEGITPGETKKNHVVEPLEEPVGAVGAKPPRPRPKKPKRPPSIEVFRKMAHRFPAKSWWKKIDEAVGEDEANLERWGKVVFNWVGTGWGPINVKGMLDFYERKEIPGDRYRATGPPGGDGQTPAQIAADIAREIEAQEAQDG